MRNTISMYTGSVFFFTFSLQNPIIVIDRRYSPDESNITLRRKFSNYFTASSPRTEVWPNFLERESNDILTIILLSVGTMDSLPMYSSCSNMRGSGSRTLYASFYMLSTTNIATTTAKFININVYLNMLYIYIMRNIAFNVNTSVTYMWYPRCIISHSTPTRILEDEQWEIEMKKTCRNNEILWVFNRRYTVGNRINIKQLKCEPSRFPSVSEFNIRWF